MLAVPMAVPVGSWIAASRQPPGYDGVRQTLSTLSRTGAPDRWVMTATLLAVGCTYLLAALAADRVTPAGRVVMGVGGLGTVLTGLLPQPFVGSSVLHMGAATVAWVAFTLWPLAACPRPPVPGLHGRRAAWLATTLLLVLVGWFVVQLRAGGAHLGLAERCLILAQTVWPAVVVVAPARDRYRGPAR